ncbi:MAG: lysophospholipid acyltransferase family protein [Candidatus Aminicenantales bacterium]
MTRSRMGFWYRAGWSFFRVVFAAFFRWRVLNPGRVPDAGPVILAANHASYFDPPLVGAGLPRMVVMLARRSLFRFPGFGRLLRLWHTVPVDPKSGSAAALKTVLSRLAAGNAVLIFPEGARSFDGRLQPARAGLGLVVVKSAASVVPVRIWGSHEAYGRGSLLPRPRRITVKYGRPLFFIELREEAAHCSKPRFKEICREVADRVMAEIARMEPVPDEDPPRPDPEMLPAL